MKTSTRWYRTPQIVLEMDNAARDHINTLSPPGTIWFGFFGCALDLSDGPIRVETRHWPREVPLEVECPPPP